MNKTLKIVLSIVVVVIIATFTLSHTKETGEVRIGVISGTTGTYGAAGEAFNKGVLLAEEEYKKEHPDKQFKLIFENDYFEGKRGLSAYHKLTDIDKIDGLINMTTFTIETIAGLVEKRELPVAQGFVEVESKDDTVFQLWPGVIPAEIKLGEEIRSRGFKNVVLFYEGSSAAYKSFADGFKKGYNLPLQEMQVSSERSNLKNQALKAISYKPDAAVFILSPEMGALLIKEINIVSKSKIQYVFDSNLQAGFNQYQEILGNKNILDGSIVSTIPTIYTDSFKKAYKAKYGMEASIGAETGYNSYMLLINSYNKSSKQWVRNMKMANLSGADGQIEFDELGVRVPKLKIGTIQNAKLPE
jgi:ABC-type branched-subunit amino acid transport system substrate-binding protein